MSKIDQRQATSAANRATCELARAFKLAGLNSRIAFRLAARTIFDARKNLETTIGTLAAV